MTQASTSPFAPTPTPSSAGPVPEPVATASTSEPASAPKNQGNSGETLLVQGYVFLWILLMGWLLFMWRKQARLHERLDALEKAIDAGERNRAGAEKGRESG